MLDHHFVERHPGHQHIYLGNANPEHGHDFQPFHSHNGLAMILVGAELPPANAPDDIVFVVPAGGYTHVVADITSPANARSIVIGADGGSGILGYNLASVAVPAGASVAPPTLPPRA